MDDLARAVLKGFKILLVIWLLAGLVSLFKVVFR